METGERIGALCIIDHEEKNISQEKKTLLLLVAEEIVKKLEYKKKIGFTARSVGQGYRTT